MMQLSIATALASCCVSAHAFTDSSPFFLFSTTRNAEHIPLEQLQSSIQVLKMTRDFLSSCPTERYLLISQPNVNVAHFKQSSSTSNLGRAFNGSKIRSRYAVAEVSGSVEIQDIANYIEKACNGRQYKPGLEVINLEALTNKEPISRLQANDDDLGLPLEQLELESSYTVIYTGSIHVDSPSYHPEFEQDTTRAELKRQIQSNSIARRANVTDNRSLFEKYQFFTPGIFMALVTLAVLLSILFSGISALASLKVSYGAFDKEMGPAAQKKQN